MESTVDIFKPDDILLCTINFNTDSYRRWQVMGENSVILNFSLPQVPNGLVNAYLDIPVGSYITYKNNRYTLYNPCDFTKNSNRNYSYTIKLYAFQELLNDRIFINEPDGMQVFPRQGRPQDFLEAIVRNMNHFDTGNWDGTEWSMGDFISSNIQQNIQFNGVSCFEALRLVAEAFKTEWEINNKTISLRKVEYYKENPLKLMYGGGQLRDVNSGGLVPGLGRGNFDQSRPIYKLYVKGGERNIEFGTYGSQTLLLPKNRTIRFDGTYFDDETGFNSEIAREYTTSADGTYVIRTDVPQISRREAFVELTEAYPKWVGTIRTIIWIYNNVEYTVYDTALTTARANGDSGADIFCDIIDTAIPYNMDFRSMRIKGEQAIIVPQSGRLSGREIGIEQTTDSLTGYVWEERRFKLITDSDYGSFIPDNRLQVGDTYAVFGVNMPSAYVSLAEIDLLKDAVRYKYENEELRFTFKGQIDGIWSQKNWDIVEPKIIAGGYVNFSDPQFHPDGSLIRIAAIKEYLYEPYKPEIELTNIVLGGGIRSELAEIPQQEVVISQQEKESRRLQQRRFRDIEELRGQLSNVFTDFDAAISPVSVHSMQYISGNKMGQFRYVDNLNSNNEVSAPTIVYNPNNNTVQISGRTAGFISYIQHQELASDSYKNNQSLNDSDYLEMDGKSPTGDNSTIIRPANEYKSWAIPAYTNPSSEPLIKDRFYWVYAKVSKTTTNGTYLVETTARTAFEDSDYYYLVVGGLNSEHDGIRGWSPLFGFTEILPGQITTGLIRSSDGNSYFDLAAGIFHVGNIDSYLDWDSERLAIHNARLNITRSDGVDAIDLRPDGSGMLASNNIFWDEDGNLTASGLIQSALVGRRFIIDPDSASLIFYDNNNTEIGRWNYNGQWGSTVRVVNGNINTSVTPTVIIMTDNSGASSILGNYLAGELVLNATGSKRVRFDTTSQTYLIAQLSNLPTSSSGLASGSLYRSGSQVMIVP